MNQSQEKKLRTILENGNQLLTLKEVLDIALETKLPDEIEKLLTTTRQRAWEMFIAEQEETMRPNTLDKSPKPKEQPPNP
jgi:hypothetical protein